MKSNVVIHWKYLVIVGILASLHFSGGCKTGRSPSHRITTSMESFVAQGEIAGCVTLVANREEILHWEATGLRDIDTLDPMDKCDIFRIASMTKPITGAALMILQDEGKLQVDDPVAKYLPEYANIQYNDQPLSSPLTIKQLLTHTSGIQFPPNLKVDSTIPLSQQASLMASTPLQFEPGSQWKYSKGLNVIGYIIEVVTGQPFDTYLTERIFKPLHMQDTRFVLSDTQVPRLAGLYKKSKDTGSLVRTESRLHPADPTSSCTPNPSGGLYSTAQDIARFYQALLNGGELDGVRILSQKAVQEMTSPQTNDLETGFVPGSAWGLGCGIVHEPQGVTAMLSPGTYGHGGAFGTQSWANPKQGLVYILMIQRTDLGNGDASDMRRIFQQETVNTLTSK